MKAIVLAGGYAKRLFPLTENRSKALIDVGGKPVIEYIVEKLDKIEDVDEIIISTNARFESDFKQWLAGLGTKKSVKLVVENSMKEGEKLGAIGGINHTIQSCDINEDCLIISGDNVFDFELTDFINAYKEKKTVLNAVFDVGDREKAKQLGVVTLQGDRITKFIEKPTDPPTTLVSTGSYVFPKGTLPLFSQYLDEGNNKDAPGFFLQWLHQKEIVSGFSFSTNWFDIGSQDSLDAARKFLEKR